MGKLKQEDTICHRINESIDEIENAFNGSCNLLKIAKNLHEIRTAATRMEMGLKRRKKLMMEAEIEEIYQKQKGKLDTPPGINKIANVVMQAPKKFQYEFIVKDKGEVVYQNKVHAGIMTVVERVSGIDEMGSIDSQCQHFMFGHVLNQWVAFSRLQQTVEAKMIQIKAAFIGAVKEKKFADKETKEKLLQALNF